MPLISAPSTKGHEGFATVAYRDAKGRTRNCDVLGPGSSSGLKIRYQSYPHAIIDNVPSASGSTLKQTGVYWYRRGPTA